MAGLSEADDGEAAIASPPFTLLAGDARPVPSRGSAALRLHREWKGSPAEQPLTAPSALPELPGERLVLTLPESTPLAVILPGPRPRPRRGRARSLVPLGVLAVVLGLALAAVLRGLVSAT